MSTNSAGYISDDSDFEPDPSPRFSQQLHTTSSRRGSSSKKKKVKKRRPASIPSNSSVSLAPLPPLPPPPLTPHTSKIFRGKCHH